jgi:hypothetical protein
MYSPLDGLTVVKRDGELGMELDRLAEART